MNTRAHGQTPSKPATRGGALSFLSCLAVLAASAFGPENDWLRVARGKTRIGRELRGVETRGYYEALIDANRGPAAEAVAEPPPGWIPFGAAGIVEPIPTYLRWRMRPNLDLVWNGVPFRTNSRGYRTPEVASPKPEGVFRVVVFGSSNTMGHGVGDDDAYPRLLERWLNESFATGRRIEVVNLAVSGDSPSRRLARMIEEGEGSEPDWILCDATVLDPALEAAHLETVVRADPPTPIPPALHFVTEALARAGASPSDTVDAFRLKIRHEAEPLLEEAYKGWAEYARRTGVPLTVVVIPRADEKLDNAVLDRIMHAAIRHHRLDVLDLGDAFRDLAAEEFRVSPWDKHPSVRGHRAIFEAFRSALLARGTLPGLDLDD
ncbi:SGNH/GDSL hydrolase family protein [Paludisphaera mucosa]|uniref:GDSL-type esterase/lipase family protein n=1 Tax=Paludisphaera mucosa TaxID=3030827 RepID=A0ABT6FB11_9BACT|nr:GDSL-type esterase/lipase family protein [Paludisphaera mucosa]MDG3004731.1 GDSL-type esterase/lipase family protein [Paludisphaera mucosa]